MGSRTPRPVGSLQQDVLVGQRVRRSVTFGSRMSAEDDPERLYGHMRALQNVALAAAMCIAALGNGEASRGRV